MHAIIKNRFKCTCCDKVLRTAQGLKIHTTKLHGGQLEDRRTTANFCSQTYVKSVGSASQPESAFSTSEEREGDFMDILSNWKQNTTVMKRIPKAARMSSAESLNKCIDQCVHDNSATAWFRLASFAFCVFCLPDTSRETRSTSLATLVKKNILVFDSGGAVSSTIRNGFGRSLETTGNMQKRVESKILDGDIRGAIRVLSSEDSVADSSQETLEALKEKHPQERDNMTLLEPESSSEACAVIEVSPSEILKAIQSFPNGSAGGLDGLRPQHLKDMLGHKQDDVAGRLLQSLARLVTLMLRGEVQKDICQFLYGASLTALKKKCGGIRPIAVGNTLRRLAAKVVSNRVHEEMGELLRPRQLGYGTRGGAEAAVHAAHSYLDKNTEGCRVFLKIDFQNAFNSVHRDVLLDGLKKDLPAYYPFFWQAYGNHTSLLYHDTLITSERGVQQGDPLGPLAFCVLIHPLVTMLQSEFNVWYLDDGGLGGKPKTVLRDLESIISWQEEYGLELNSAKCELHIIKGAEKDVQGVIQMFQDIAPGIRVVGREGICLLGSPLTEEAIPLALEKRLAEVALLTSRLEGMQSHQAFYLLKNCLGIPKLMYTLRTSPVWTHPEKLHQIDEFMRESLQKITNSTLDNAAWRQATLPVCRGGLGIRLTEELALPAYLASVHSVSSLVSIISPDYIVNDNLNAARSKWTEITASEVPPMEHRSKQSQWDKPVIEKQYNDVRELLSHDQKSRARFLASSSKESGAWLNALPSPALGNLLDDDSFRISIALRLGSAICHQHVCVCGQVVDQHGHHGLCCRKSAGRHSRHGSINDVICRSLVSAGIPSRREPLGVIRQDGKRPDGITLVPWKEGRCLVWDATCVDTLATSHLETTAHVRGSAAMRAEELKTDKYRNLDGRYIFCPVGFETFGPWGPDAKYLIAAIGKRLFEKTGEKRSTEFLRQRLSMEIQRGNAASVFGTFPFSKGLEEVFFLL